MISGGVNPLETFDVEGDDSFMKNEDVTKLWTRLSSGKTIYPTGNPDNSDEVKINLLGRAVKYSPNINQKIPYLSFITCGEAEMIDFNTNLFKINTVVMDELNQYDDILPCSGTRRIGRVSIQGTMEHWLIQYDYILRNPLAVREFKIPKSSALGNTGYADLANPLTREIYEIKSLGQKETGRDEVKRYVDKANDECPGNGISWIKGKSYLPSPRILPNPRDISKELVVTLDEDGLIIYRTQPRTSPDLQPVRVPENIHQKIKKFLEKIEQSTQNLDKEITIFLQQNPEVITYLKAVAVGTAAVIIVGTIVEDVVTLGAGIADDFASFALAYRLVRIAQLL